MLNPVASTFLALTFMFHLMRLPHLVIEHGGGAFILLFFLLVIFVSLPLLIAEQALGGKLSKVQMRSLILFRRDTWFAQWDRLLIVFWLGLRLVALNVFLSFFLMVSSLSLVYLGSYLKFWLAGEPILDDLPLVPEAGFGFVPSGLWVALLIALSFKVARPLQQIFQKALIPITFALLLFLGFRMIGNVDDFAGVSALFYPDFGSLNFASLQQALGHCLLCFFVGLGLYEGQLKDKEGVDPIEFFIHLVVQTLLVGLLVGVMAVPMMQQVRETPFGSNWVFEILPRWLSYDLYGRYYCALFFACILVISSYLCVQLIRLIEKVMGSFFIRRMNRTKIIRGALLLFALHTALLPYVHGTLQGWTGQGVLLSWDFVTVDLLMPLSALFLLWVTLRYTRTSERMAVFSRQSMFFHHRYFYKAWEMAAAYALPTIIGLSLLLSLSKSL